MSENAKPGPHGAITASAAAMDDAVEVVQEAASAVERNVTEGIQPDINELRLYVSELNEAANIRQKRLLWSVWVLIGLNLLTLISVFLT